MGPTDEGDADEVLASAAAAAAERRLGTRHLACFPAYLKRDDGTQRVSMIRDLSATGAQLLVRADVKVGDAIHLQLFIKGDVANSRDVAGKIVRVEKLEDPYSGPWSLRIAVQFDEDLDDVLPEIAALARRQASIPPSGPHVG
jgi:hypothetical protein